MKNTHKLFILSLVIFTAFGLSIVNSVKADTTSCNAYCVNYGYDRGLCSTSCSVYPACLFNYCYYNCYDIGGYPCDYSGSCLCVDQSSCDCATKTCTNSGCQTAASKPSLTTNQPASITYLGGSYYDAMLSGNITSTGGAAITARGFHYGTSQTSYFTAAETGSFGTGAYQLSGAITSPGSTYYVRAWATNSAGTSYGSWLSFKIEPVETFDFSLSVIPPSWGTANQGASVSAIITASLVSGSAQSVSFSAFNLPTAATAAFSPTSCTPGCSTTLTINTSASTPTGTKTITITGAGGGKTKTTSYSLTVNAGSSVLKPTVTTNTASSITTTSATIGGTIVSMGGSDVLEHGFDWGTSSGSYTWNWTESGYGGITNNSKNIASLTPGTKYYFRYKARNSAG